MIHLDNPSLQFNVQGPLRNSVRGFNLVNLQYRSLTVLALVDWRGTRIIDFCRGLVCIEKFYVVTGSRQ